MPFAIFSFHNNILSEGRSSIPTDLENRLTETQRHAYNYRFFSIYDASREIPRHTILNWVESSDWKIHSMTENKYYQTFLMHKD